MLATSAEKKNMTATEMAQGRVRSLAEENILAGGGEMGALMRAHDWAASPLGPVRDWPPSLRTVVSLALNSQFPTIIFWGPDLVMLYNDAYRPIADDKHPAALGRPAREFWSEVWSIAGPMLHGVLETGQATWSYDLLLPIIHNGTVGEHYFTFSYSPIRDESGKVCGVFCPVTETTERVQQERREQALRHEAEAAHARVRTTLESITDAFYTLDRQWRFTSFNQRAKELWGRPQHDFLGTNIWAEFPGAEGLIFGEQLHKAMAEQVAVTFEGFYQPLGLWMEVHAYPSSEGLAVYFQDITERKRAEEALRESGARHAFLLDLSDALRPLTDPVEIQEAAARVLGEHLQVSRAFYVEIESAAEGDSFVVRRDYCAPSVASHAGRFRGDDFGATAFGELRAGRTLAVANVEGDPRLTDAERAAYLALDIRAYIGVPLVKRGRHVAVLGVHQTVPRAWTKEDIALVEETAERTWAAVERARAERAVAEDLKDTQLLRELGARFITEGDIQTLSQEILDAAITLTRAEMGSMQMFYPEKNQLRLLAWKGFDPASAEFWEWVRVDSCNTCGVALTTGERVIVPDVETCEFMAGTEDLEVYRLSGIRAAQSTPLVSRGGRVVGMISTHWRARYQPSERELRLLDVLARQAADLIERKEAADAQARLLADVQHVNAELQQFSYIVSHDLNEPLRTMNNYVQLLARRLKGKLDESATEDMAFVTDAARRMQQMLTDLLAYTRAGQTPEFRAVDCEALLVQVVDDVRVTITEQQATLTYDPLPTVPGDASRLRQVFQNLISNALKFCKERPRIHVSAAKEDRYWRFAVRDNGIGIDPQQAGRLFQVFRRLHTRGEYPGTGIGLAICKRIVEQHGGRIWVESAVGHGATFFFTIAGERGK